jgi:hypothetical protein
MGRNKPTQTSLLVLFSFFFSSRLATKVGTGLRVTGVMVGDDRVVWFVCRQQYGRTPIGGHTTSFR